MPTLEKINEYQSMDVDDLNHEYITACYQGNFDTIKYLLTSDDLFFNAEIDAEKSEGFKEVCDGGYKDILEFLILEQQLERNDDINYYIRYGIKDNFPLYMYAVELFENRELILLNRKMNKDLVINDKTISKLKI